MRLLVGRLALSLVAALLTGPSCRDAEPAAIETACDNGVDDDGDGTVDCDDPDCAAAPACDVAPPRPCSSQLDCGRVVDAIIADVCLGGLCLPPGSADRKRVAHKVSIYFDLTYEAGFPQSPRSAVVRLVHPVNADGSTMTCALLASLSGSTEATRSQLDDNRNVNQVFRNLYPTSNPGPTTQKVVFPNVAGFEIPRGKGFLLSGEAWYGARELQNPTGNRASVDCVEGVDLEAASEFDHFALGFWPP